MTEPTLDSDSTAVIETLRDALAGVRDLVATTDLPTGLRQELLRAAVISYARAWQQEGGAVPFGNADEITATDAVVTASALLRALNIELFELAMWQTTSA